jgi:hypothetical protein
MKRSVLVTSLLLGGCSPFPPPLPCTCPSGSVEMTSESARRSCAASGQVQVTTQTGHATVKCFGSGSCDKFCLPLAQCGGCFKKDEKGMSCGCGQDPSADSGSVKHSGTCRSRCRPDEVCGVKGDCVVEKDLLACGDRLPEFDPCVGDVSGSWEVVSQCPAHAKLNVVGENHVWVEMADDEMQSAHPPGTRKVKMTGRLNFKQDGTIADESSAFLETTLFLPSIGRSAADCAAYTTSAKHDSTLRCDPDADGCRCSSRQPVRARMQTPFPSLLPRPGKPGLPLLATVPALDPRSYCVRQQYLDVNYDFGRIRFKKVAVRKEAEAREPPRDGWFIKQE